MPPTTCPDCSNDNPDGAAFCSSCGRALADPEATQQLEPTPAATAETPGEPRRRRGRTVALVAILVAISLAAGWFAASSFMSDEPDDDLRAGTQIGTPPPGTPASAVSTPAAPTSDPGDQPPSDPPLPQMDCTTYDPDIISVDSSGGEWFVVEGVDILTEHTTEAHANRMLDVMTRFNERCTIGAGNPRPNPQLFTVEHYAGTGKAGALPLDDCYTYDHDGLQVVDDGPDGWFVSDGNFRLVTLHTQADAGEALKLANLHETLCWVGRNTVSPHTYWVTSG